MSYFYSPKDGRRNLQNCKADGFLKNDQCNWDRWRHLEVHHQHSLIPSLNSQASDYCWTRPPHLWPWKMVNDLDHTSLQADMVLAQAIGLLSGTLTSFLTGRVKVNTEVWLALRTRLVAAVAAQAWDTLMSFSNEVEYLWRWVTLAYADRWRFVHGT